LKWAATTNRLTFSVPGLPAATTEQADLAAAELDWPPLPPAARDPTPIGVNPSATSG